MGGLSESRRLTRERFGRRNQLKARGRKRRRVFTATPFGRSVTVDLFIEPLASFLAGELPEKPYPPPGDFATACDLDCPTLALIALAPLLDSIMRGWRGRDTALAEQRLWESVGRYCCDRLALERLRKSPAKSERRLCADIRRGRKRAWKYLKSDWTNEESVAVGRWLTESALSLNYFVIDERGFPAIAPEWREEMDRIRDELLWREPYLLPHIKPPPDWTGFNSQYGDRLSAGFVRDWRPETKAAMTEAFREPFEHASGVNALQRVPFCINGRVLPLVERHAVDVLNHKGDQRSMDESLVASDIAVAKRLVAQPFYLTYNCDKRGRVFPIPHFNYGREDHLRALFNFNNGTRAGEYGLYWLEVHCANCGGYDAIDKAPWADRLRWSQDNRRVIERIASDPEGTISLWRLADKPFGFLAACFELVGAWNDPADFVTRLPVGFDATCSGIQHLALLARDAAAGKLVNLTGELDGEGNLHDIYLEVTNRVMTALALDDNERARWWCQRLDALDQKRRRKLFKSPVMTLSYGVTEYGMAEKITESYAELFDHNEPPIEAANYLASKIREACRIALPGPVRVMDHIQQLALSRYERGLFLEWESPTGFPVANRYQKPKTRDVYLPRDGVRVTCRIADGALPRINKRKALNAAAPNFVHSLDAAHLIKTVLVARENGIADLVCVHDSFACLAPNGFRFLLDVIKPALAKMYEQHDPLAELHKSNVWGSDVAPPPRYGTLKPSDVLRAEYAFI